MKQIRRGGGPFGKINVEKFQHQYSGEICIFLLYALLKDISLHLIFVKDFSKNIYA